MQVAFSRRIRIPLGLIGVMLAVHRAWVGRFKERADEAEAST